MDFLKEFRKLRETAPRLALRVTLSENCDYTNFASHNRNCYLVTGAAEDEDCYYATTILNCSDCVDCYAIFESELCYECIDCENCYNGNFLQDCKNVRDGEYCFDCIGSEYIFGCVSRRNKKYMIFNEQYDKETYFEKLKEIKLWPESKILKMYQDLQIKTPRVYGRILKCEHVTGDYLVNAKNSFMCFDGHDVEDSLYQERPLGVKDCVDCSNLYKGCELNYMVMSGIHIVNCNFCFAIDDSSNLEYCIHCFNSNNLFGCISRNRAEYEILNKKYPKEEWHKRVTEIKDRMREDGTYGTMFESDFPYSDSIAVDYIR
mgnify:CR=1 FL=1